jgi:catechol 2,3-dioxygenase-like lactoylglutathione lyase family enzyme
MSTSSGFSGSLPSHDLQEPLRLISIYAELLVGKNDPPADDPLLFERTILEGTARMRELIADLLAYTRIRGQGGDQESTVAVDLNGVIEIVRSNLKPSIDDTGTVIISDILPAIRAHTSRMVALFQNLIGNAIKYRSEQPQHIRIAVQEIQAELQFSVRDNGIGIDPEYHKDVFVAFKRLHSGLIPGLLLSKSGRARLCSAFRSRHARLNARGGAIQWAPMWKSMFAFVIAVPCFAQAPLVKGVGNFIHNVADLDQSVHFYKDILGMDVPRPAGDWQTTDGVLKMYGAVGGRFRTATAQVTGVAMRVELAEFQGVDRKPVRRSLGEPGTSVLILTVAEVQPVLDRMKSSNWPLSAPLTTACNGSGIAMADPDGFQILVLQRTGAGAAAAAGKNFTDLRFGYTVSSEAVLNGPFKALLLTGRPFASACRTIEESILNASTLTVVRLPDGFEITLVPSAPGKRSAGTARPRDPGAAVLRLAVPDAEAAVRALGDAGVKVVSEGGAIQTLPPAGLKATILGAPDNLFVQVLQ